MVQYIFKDDIWEYIFGKDSNSEYLLPFIPALFGLIGCALQIPDKLYLAMFVFLSLYGFGVIMFIFTKKAIQFFNK